MSSGWIKIHRIALDWEWYKTPNMVQFFIHCLLRANHKKGKWQGIELEPGQFISGRKQLSLETGLSERNIRTCIKHLKSTNEMTSKSYAKFSVFTINSWNKYQLEDDVTSNVTSKRPASDQQVTTNKNVKNEKNEKNLLASEIINYLNITCNKNFSDKTQSTLKHINARLNEGRTFSDFKKVIEIKSLQWLNHEKMDKFLCPDTLFSPTNFEKYLNEKKGDTHVKQFKRARDFIS